MNYYSELIDLIDNKMYYLMKDVLKKLNSTSQLRVRIVVSISSKKMHISNSQNQ